MLFRTYFPPHFQNTSGHTLALSPTRSLLSVVFYDIRWVENSSECCVPKIISKIVGCLETSIFYICMSIRVHSYPRHWCTMVRLVCVLQKYLFVFLFVCVKRVKEKANDVRERGWASEQARASRPTVSWVGERFGRVKYSVCVCMNKWMSKAYDRSRWIR